MDTSQHMLRAIYVQGVYSVCEFLTQALIFVFLIASVDPEFPLHQFLLCGLPLCNLRLQLAWNNQMIGGKHGNLRVVFRQNKIR
jgi:hypothetical protein